MLKIKDGVDLKELEKYGFKREYIIDDIGWIITYKKGAAYKEYIIIWEKDRKIQVTASYLLDTLYDLIKADLVEKVKWISDVG